MILILAIVAMAAMIYVIYSLAHSISESFLKHERRKLRDHRLAMLKAAEQRRENDHYIIDTAILEQVFQERNETNV